jgi:EAL domain-containing protein (putative c-di-GMP-specific phosphodiesterase class I)
MLDRSLVMGSDHDTTKIIAGLRCFADEAGCQLIAEGIESEEEWVVLLRAGVRFGRSYLFGRLGPLE